MQLRYATKAYAYLPVTFLKRGLSRDPYWRQYFWNRWGFLPRNVAQLASRAPLWIEAYGGGEVTQLGTLCRLLREEFPQLLVVLSTNNLYSFRYARSRLSLDAVFDTPWDLSGPVRRALNRLAPRSLCFVESVKYPVLARAARDRGIQAILINGFISRGWKDHSFMQRAVQMGAYRSLDAVGARSEEDAEVFRGLGVPPDRITVTGNMKADPESVRLRPEERAALLARLGWQPDAPVFVAGSVRRGEDQEVVGAYREVRRRVPELKLVFAPSYNDRHDLTALMSMVGAEEAIRLSELEARQGHGRPIVVVDTFGDLPRLYGLGTVVFVGSLVYGKTGYGHNLMEPMLHGVPIVVGPFVGQWREFVEEFRAEWDGAQVGDGQGLARSLAALLESPALHARLAARVTKAVEGHLGAVQTTIEFLKRHLPILGGSVGGHLAG